ncbi:hypothetical protein HY643_02240 [Candidatus Woesearchaeota archaeon]|nr:hypothetical protein [Candidatus Woesearchaeota archaeon]
MRRGHKKVSGSLNSLEDVMFIAPHDVLRREYFSLLDEVSLRTDEENRRLLLMQSFVGRAQNGNGHYCREKNVNTTMDDLVAFEDEIKNYWSLNKKLTSGEVRDFIKKKRQERIDSAKGWVKRALKGEKLTHLADESDSPLFGVENFRNWQVKNPINVLKGIYYGSRMDNYEWRKKVNEKYGTEIGGGICCAINFQRMQEHDLDLFLLSKNAWSEDEIKKFKEEGVIVDETKVESTMLIKNAYVRKKVGSGVSDDLALVMAGMLHGTDGFFGLFLADAIDTWDKYVPNIYAGGQDELLGDFIAQHISKQDIPSEEDVMKFIYAAAMPAHKKEFFSDNSQRYMLQIDDNLDQTALESHYKFVKGQKFKRMRLGHHGSKAKNTTLYAYATEKFKDVYSSS